MVRVSSNLIDSNSVIMNAKNTLAVFSALFLVAPVASAAVIVEMQFGTLPSEQGWIFDPVGNHATVSESTAFTATPNSLVQTTVGLAMEPTTPGALSYNYFTEPELEVHDVITIFFTTAVTAHEQSRQDFSYAGHRFEVIHNGRSANIGIKPNELFANGTYFTPTGFDGSIQNNYQVTLDTSDNTYRFYWNGDLVNNGVAATNAGAAGFRLFDGTGTANANAELTQFVAVTGTVIPEISVSMLASLAAIGLICRRVRNR